jgi:hypothetical protein
MYFDLMADAAASAASGDAAARAVSYLHEISPEMRGCAIFARGGELVAASGGAYSDASRWAERGPGFIAAADSAGSEPVSHAHVATTDGEVFCVRHGDLVGVAVTERFALASLMIFDLRSVLRDLANGKGEQGG